MQSQKVTVKDQLGRDVTGTRVEIKDSKDLSSRVEFDDGTVMVIKPVVVQAVRVDGQWDNDGNPFYIIKSQIVLAVIEAADEFKKKE